MSGSRSGKHVRHLALHAAGRGHQERPVAIGADRLAGLDEVTGDGDGLRFVPEIFRSPAAREYQAVVARRVDLIDPEVCLDSIAGLLRVGVETWLEIVDDREK